MQKKESELIWATTRVRGRYDQGVSKQRPECTEATTRLMSYFDQGV